MEPGLGGFHVIQVAFQLIQLVSVPELLSPHVIFYLPLPHIKRFRQTVTSANPTTMVLIIEEIYKVKITTKLTK